MGLEQPKGLYHVGTLVYTRKQLAKVCLWLLWGDVCFILMESVVPSILPLKFGRLGASNTAIGLILVTIPLLINGIANPVISFRSDVIEKPVGATDSVHTLYAPFSGDLSNRRGVWRQGRFLGPFALWGIARALIREFSCGHKHKRVYRGLRFLQHVS